MTRLEAQDIAVHVAGQALLSSANVCLTRSELTVVLGPNGAGKTTLLRALLGIQTLAQGDVLLDGKPLASFTSVQRARKISYLPQARTEAWPLRVDDAVALGRFAYGVAISQLGEDDTAAVDYALAACELEHLRSRAVDTLSGGELARVHLARVYAANTPLLIADEPIAGLDPRQQHRVMHLLRSYVDAGHGVLLVLHDVNLALAYADRVIGMRGGEIIGDFPLAQLDEEFIAQLYGVEAKFAVLPEGYGPQIFFAGPRKE